MPLCWFCHESILSRDALCSCKEFNVTHIYNLYKLQIEFSIYEYMGNYISLWVWAAWPESGISNIIYLHELDFVSWLSVFKNIALSPHLSKHLKGVLIVLGAKSSSHSKFFHTAVGHFFRFFSTILRESFLLLSTDSKFVFPSLTFRELVNAPSKCHLL